VPERIQLRRTPGWRLPPGARSVARPTIYGNPFGLLDELGHGNPLRPFLDAAVLEVTDLDSRAYAVISPSLRSIAVAAHRLWLKDQPTLIEQARRELRGCDIGCWCSLPDAGQPDHCHGYTWLLVANDLEIPTGRTILSAMTCVSCSYDGYGRAFEQQPNGTWRCEACPPPAEGAPSADRAG
jgi:hypothetical protein